jgi:uncharacterized protein (UPF0332 family)
MPLTEAQLLNVAKADAHTADLWNAGVVLFQAAGESIFLSQCRVVAARLTYADSIRAHGTAIMALPQPIYRLAVNRFYYAMYHFMRAVVYFDARGDDHQEHSVLPTQIPQHFPNRDQWRTTLKEARLGRNSADYDPYPPADANWQQLATTLQVSAHDLAVQCLQYLRQRGCHYV